MANSFGDYSTVAEMVVLNAIFTARNKTWLVTEWARDHRVLFGLTRYHKFRKAKKVQEIETKAQTQARAEAQFQAAKAHLKEQVVAAFAAKRDDEPPPLRDEARREQ